MISDPVPRIVPRPFVVKSIMGAAFFTSLPLLSSAVQVAITTSLLSAVFAPVLSVSLSLDGTPLVSSESSVLFVPL